MELSFFPLTPSGSAPSPSSEEPSDAAEDEDIDPDIAAALEAFPYLRGAAREMIRAGQEDLPASARDSPGYLDPEELLRLTLGSNSTVEMLNIVGNALGEARRQS